MTPRWFVDAVALPLQRRTLAMDGIALNYFVWGDRTKPPIVLVHGGAAHAMWWSPLAPLLAQDYYVVAPDLSGHGDSGRRELYPLEGWAEEILAIAEHAGCAGAPMLVGHSMGGLVSIVAAALHGPRLAGAIIVDSPIRRPDPESKEGESGRAFRDPKTYPDLATALAHFHLVPMQPCDNDWFVDHVARHSVRETPGGWAWKFDPRVFHRFPPKTLHDYLARVLCRVALLRGEMSAVVSSETGQYMYELLNRNAPLVEIPQAYHHLILDQPLAFIAALRALLADWEHSVPHRRTSPIDQH